MDKKNKHIIKKIRLNKLLKEYKGKLTFDTNNIHFNHEIKIFPKKRCYIEKYDRYISFNDKFFNELITNFNNEKLSKPFLDLNHDEKESMATILELINKEDGLYAVIKLNNKGYEKIKDEEYMYVSPSVTPKKDCDGNEYNNVLTSVTLTNIPALEGELPSLQEQLQLEKNNKSEKLKKDKIANICNDIKNIIKDKKMDYNLKLSKLEKKFNSIKLENGEASIDPMMIEEILGMARELVKVMEEAVSGKEKAEEAVEEMSKELAGMKEKEEEEIKAKMAREKDELFTMALEKGKITIKESEVLKKMYDKSPEDVKALLESKEESDEDFTQLSKKSEINIKLSEEDKAILLERGIELTKENIEKYSKLFVKGE